MPVHHTQARSRSPISIDKKKIHPNNASQGQPIKPESEKEKVKRGKRK
jgi:hypothetical protein